MTLAERVYSSYVNDIEHVESQSLNGLSIIKVYFQPDADVQAGMAQLTAASQGVTHNMPPGISPPFMIRFNATDVPILQLGLGSPKRTESELNDLATNFIRVPLATVHGVTRAAGVRRRAAQHQRRHRSAGAVRQGLVAGRRERGDQRAERHSAVGHGAHGRRASTTCASTRAPIRRRTSANIPIKQVNGATVYLRDVAQVRDGAGVQTNIVRENGHRGTYLTMLKNGKASTLGDRRPGQGDAAAHPRRTAARRHARSCSATSRSTCARRSPACCARASSPRVLTALMILLFLGSWRSTIIVAMSIPLSVLVSIICLWAHRARRSTS